MHPNDITWDTSNEALRNAMREVVAEQGADFIYEDELGFRGEGAVCKYVHRSVDAAPAAPHPGCLIGQALYRCGVPLEWLDRADSGYFGGTTASIVVEKLGFTELVAIAAGVAQRSQDSGDRWGLALAAFDGYYDEH